MSERDRAAERAAAVAGAMDDIAKIDAAGREHGAIDRAGVERIKERMLLLAERGDLFGDGDFPPPDSPQSSVSYRIAQNDDELALYVQCVTDGTSAPPHEHTTWAVIVGLRGQELNRLYGPCAGGASRRCSTRWWSSPAAGWRCSANRASPTSASPWCRATRGRYTAPAPTDQPPRSSPPVLVLELQETTRGDLTHRVNPAKALLPGSDHSKRASILESGAQPRG